MNSSPGSTNEFAVPPTDGFNGASDQNQNPIVEPQGETGGFGSQVGEGPERSRMPRATLAMIGLFALGMIVVAALSLRGGPRQASAEDQAAEKTVDSFIKQSREAAELTHGLQDTRKVVGAFYDYASRRQVPVEDLQANPFVFGENSGPETAAVPTGRAGPRKAQLDAALAKLKLQSVMMGARGGTAIVGNQFVAEGHTVGEFTVRRIHPDRVELECEGMQFVLQMRQ